MGEVSLCWQGFLIIKLIGTGGEGFSVDLLPTSRIHFEETFDGAFSEKDKDDGQLYKPSGKDFPILADSPFGTIRKTLRKRGLLALPEPAFRVLDGQGSIADTCRFSPLFVTCMAKKAEIWRRVYQSMEQEAGVNDRSVC